MDLTRVIKKILEVNEPIHGIKPRDSDKVLIVRVIRSFGVALNEQQERALMRINFESIRRTRQKFQETGQYMPSPEVARKRRLKGYEIQQTITNTRPEKVAERIVLPWGE